MHFCNQSRKMLKSKKSKSRRRKILAKLAMASGPFKNDVTAKLGISDPLPPLSPLVTILVDPPPPYVTGANSDKLFSVTGIMKKIKLS